MKKPKVSIIVPVYKTEKYLARCLKSLQEQTLTEIEIILVDDGSPDNCPELCDKAADEDKRIKVVHKTNAGAGMARNSGIDNAGGEYIGFVDSDDYVKKNMFEELYNAAEKYKAQLVISGMCFVGGNVFKNSGGYTENVYFKDYTLFETQEDIKQLLLGTTGALPHEPQDSRYGTSVWKNLYKKDVIEKNNIRFLSERKILSEDLLFVMDYIRNTERAVGVPAAYYYYCRNDESLSKAYDADRMGSFAVFLNELENRLKVSMPRTEYKIYFDRMAQAYVRVWCSQVIMYAQENGETYLELRKKLKDICTKKEIAISLKDYPWYKLPPKQAIFAFFVKHRLYFMQKLAVTMRSR